MPTRGIFLDFAYNNVGCTISSISFESKLSWVSEVGTGLVSLGGIVGGSEIKDADELGGGSWMLRAACGKSGMEEEFLDGDMNGVKSTYVWGCVLYKKWVGPKYRHRHR